MPYITASGILWLPRSCDERVSPAEMNRSWKRLARDDDFAPAEQARVERHGSGADQSDDEAHGDQKDERQAGVNRVEAAPGEPVECDRHRSRREQNRGGRREEADDEGASSEHGGNTDEPGHRRRNVRAGDQTPAMNNRCDTDGPAQESEACSRPAAGKIPKEEFQLVLPSAVATVRPLNGWHPADQSAWGHEGKQSPPRGNHPVE